MSMIRHGHVIQCEHVSIETVEHMYFDRLRTLHRHVYLCNGFRRLFRQ
jgi:hypothetical protein